MDTVTTIGCNLYLDDTASNWTAAGFIPAFITKFVASWNALLINIDPDSNATISMGTFLKATADSGNNRIIIEPLDVEVNNTFYSQWGTATVELLTANWPVQVGGTDAGQSQADQILEVKKNTSITNWASVASGATGSDANVTTIELEDVGSRIDRYIDGSTFHVYGHNTIPDGNYTVIESNNNPDLISIVGSYESWYAATGESVLDNSDFSDLTGGTDSSSGNFSGWLGEGTHNSNSKFTLTGGDCLLSDDGTNDYCMIRNTQSLESVDSNKQRVYSYHIRIVANDVGGASAADARLRLGYKYSSGGWNSQDRFGNFSDMDGGLVEFREVGTYTGLMRALSSSSDGGNKFAVSRKNISGATNIQFDSLIITPLAGVVELGVNTPPFNIESLPLDNDSLRVPSTELTSIFDGEKTDLISFSADNNSLHLITDIDNRTTGNTSVSLLESGLSHDGKGSFIKHNKEFRLGLGPGTNSTPLWGANIRRNQLEKNLDGFHVEPQEISSTNEELSGYNYEKVITPYLPPADEMGKRWYQSQLIDMKQGITADASVTSTETGSDNFENPAYQTKLQTNNLGAVNLDSVTGGSDADKDNQVKDLFDVGTSSAHENRVTAALNNVVAGNTTSDLDTCVKPFT